MKTLLVLIFFILPLRNVENIQLVFFTSQHGIFNNYSNLNFSQKINNSSDKVAVEIESLSFFELNLNYRIFLKRDILTGLNVFSRNLILNLFANSVTLNRYLRKISLFLKENIKYSEEDLPQDPITVIHNGKANCVGYANLVRLLLDSVGITNRFIKGFYLKKEKKDTFIPIPHKWLEIQLSDGLRFFYDPQYQNFSSNYLVTEDNVDFTNIRRFRVFLLSRSKRMVN